MKQWLIGSDLDGTLLYANTDPSVRESIEAFNRALCERQGKHTLVYATGRHLEHAMKGVGEVGLIQSDFYICDVGTSVYEHIHGKFVRDEQCTMAS